MQSVSSREDHAGAGGAQVNLTVGGTGIAGQIPRDRHSTTTRYRREKIREIGKAVTKE
jgi:hypothetical protein